MIDCSNVKKRNVIKLTLRELIDKRGWAEFRLHTRIRLSDTYLNCEKMEFEDWDIQKLLDDVPYDFAVSSNGTVTWYMAD